MQLAQVELAAFGSIDLLDHVPQDLNLFLLGSDLIAEVVNEGLVFATQLSQTHAADVDRAIFARVQSRVDAIGLRLAHFS